MSFTVIRNTILNLHTLTEEICRLLNTRETKPTLFVHLQSNKMIEKSSRTLKKFHTVVVVEHQRDWNWHSSVLISSPFMKTSRVCSHHRFLIESWERYCQKRLSLSVNFRIDDRVRFYNLLWKNERMQNSEIVGKTIDVV